MGGGVGPGGTGAGGGTWEAVKFGCFFIAGGGGMGPGGGMLVTMGDAAFALACVGTGRRGLGGAGGGGAAGTGGGRGGGDDTATGVTFCGT